MAKLRIYANESVSPAVTDSLRQRHIDAWAARDVGHLGWTDEEQLAFAAEEKAAILTHDADFLRIAHACADQGREHWGVFFVQEQKLSIGECIRQLCDCAAVLDAEDMKNRVEFL